MRPGCPVPNVWHMDLLDQVTPGQKLRQWHVFSQNVQEEFVTNHSKHDYPPRNTAHAYSDDEPAASRTPVQAAAPVVDENSIRAQVLAEQKRV